MVNLGQHQTMHVCGAKSIRMIGNNIVMTMIIVIKIIYFKYVSYISRWDMSKPADTYRKSTMAFTMVDIDEYVSKHEYCFVESPLLKIPFDHIILDELHLLLRITDVLLSNLIEDAMEWDDKSDFLKKRGEPKGVHLRKLTQKINSCGVTFSIWEKKDADGKGSGKMDWTSLMGDEKKKLLRVLPLKLEESNDAIQQDTAKTVIKLWKVDLVLNKTELIIKYILNVDNNNLFQDFSNIYF